MRNSASLYMFLFSVINTSPALSSGSAADEHQLQPGGLNYPNNSRPATSLVKQISAHHPNAYMQIALHPISSYHQASAALLVICFCFHAPTPLKCGPRRPSDRENSYYGLENWSASICGDMVATLQLATMSNSIPTCVLDYIIGAGC